jgi:uncharacterized protein with PCYCGC motif
MPNRRRLFLSVLALLIVASGLLSGCGSSAAPEAEHELGMAPLADMPMDVQNAPATVRQAYQFAVANPEVMKQIPCYCGCGKMGHTSNYSCYVAEASADGKITYDPHALGCSICVDITQDTMRLLKQGKSVQAIRAYVDSTYAKFGPSNMP